MVSPAEVERRITWLRRTRAIAVEAGSRLIVTAIDDFMARAIDQLETTIFIDIPPALAAVGINWYSSVDDRRKALMLQPLEKVVKSKDRLDDWLSECADATRSANWQWRVGQEMESLIECGWYPYFVTLTVDPAYAAACDTSVRQVIEDGVEWRRYRQRLAEIARKACGFAQVQKGGPAVDDYFRYVAVVEHGSSREHHHIHALVWMRKVPVSWLDDPNIGRAIPNATDVLAAKSLWPWGSITKFEPFRCIGDPFTALGWVLPMKKGKALQVLAPAKAGAYLCKYLKKEDKLWSHRVKSTRNLGMEALDQWLRRQSPMTVLSLTRPARNFERNLLRRLTSVPTSLLRSRAILQDYSTTQSTASRFLRRLKNWKMEPENAFSAMRKSVESGTRPWSMDLPERWDWFQRCVGRKTSASCSILQDIAFNQLADIWPTQDSYPTRGLIGV